MNGTVLETEARLVKEEAALPELGRCGKATYETVEGERRYHGSYLDATCLNESRGGKFGFYEWSTGPGVGRKFTVTEGATVLETAANKKLTCAKGKGSGEYTGSKTSTVTIKLTSCKYGATKQVCQSAGAAAGEIVTSPLEGKLGYIEDQFKEGTQLISVGLDLTHASSLLSAECGAQKVPLTLSGSVIGQLTPIDAMSSAFVVQFSQAGGAQSPEAFEERAKDTLSLSVGGSSPEGAGLSAKVKLTNGEHLQVKAAV
jgi:hypothetical protein